jgi:hypothetical protein
MASPSFAEAPPPDTAKLEYQRPAAFGSCPTEPYFHHFVAARFSGIDPFTDTAPRRITVKVRRDKKLGFVAELAMYDETGKSLGSDELDEPTCLRVVESAGRRVVSWLLPIVGPDLPTAPTPSPAPPAPTPSPSLSENVAPRPAEPSSEKPASPAVPATPAPAPVRAVPQIAAGAVVDIGLATLPLVGLTVEAWLRRDWLSVGAALHVDPSQVAPLPGRGSVATTLGSARVSGCIRAWGTETVELAPCVMGELGQIYRDAGGPYFGALHQSLLYAAVRGGARIKVRLPARFHVTADGGVMGARKFGGFLGTAASKSMQTAGTSTFGIGGQMGISGGWSFW